MDAHVSVKDLNSLLTCFICKGYYRAAHTIPECNHSFCKTCIFRHFHEKNVRGHVKCPKCDISLGVYAYNSAKVINDTNLQSIVDKVFPHFGEDEKILEEKFNLDRGISKRTRSTADTYGGKKVGTKRQRSFQNSSILKNAAAEDDFNDTTATEEKGVGGDQVKNLEESNEEKLAENDEHENEGKDVPIAVKMIPRGDCDEKCRLPRLSKRIFAAPVNLSLAKLQKFVFKRLPEEVASSMSLDDVAIYFEGKHLSEQTIWIDFEHKLKQYRTAAKADINTAGSIELHFCRLRRGPGGGEE